MHQQEHSRHTPIFPLPFLAVVTLSPTEHWKDIERGKGDHTFYGLVSSSSDTTHTAWLELIIWPQLMKHSSKVIFILVDPWRGNVILQDNLWESKLLSEVLPSGQLPSTFSAQGKFIT